VHGGQAGWPAIEPSVGRSEFELIVRARAGDPRAFERIVTLHTERVHAMLRRCNVDPHDTDDLAQEVFLRAWRGLPRFDERAQLSTWLSRIAINEAHRCRARLRPAELDRDAADARIATIPESVDHGPCTRLLDLEFGLELVNALRLLPPERRTAIVLHLDGFPTRTAARIAGVREEAFKSRLRRGRLQLRDLLEPYLRLSES
jgi:RNA polymerase sigma factor (sigma-70 family)